MTGRALELHSLLGEIWRGGCWEHYYTLNTPIFCKLGRLLLLLMEWSMCSHLLPVFFTLQGALVDFFTPLVFLEELSPPLFGHD